MAALRWTKPKRKVASWLIGGVLGLVLSATTLLMAGPPAAQAVVNALSAFITPPSPATPPHEGGPLHFDPASAGLRLTPVDVSEIVGPAQLVSGFFTADLNGSSGIWHSVSATAVQFGLTGDVSMAGGGAVGAGGLGGLAAGGGSGGMVGWPRWAGPSGLPGLPLSPLLGWPGPEGAPASFAPPSPALSPPQSPHRPDAEFLGGPPEITTPEELGSGPDEPRSHPPAVPLPDASIGGRAPAQVSTPGTISLTAFAFLLLLRLRRRQFPGARDVKLDTSATGRARG